MTHTFTAQLLASHSPRAEASLSGLVCAAYAADLRLSDACRPGVAIDETGFGALEAEAFEGRRAVRDAIASLGVNPDMLQAVL
jgi:hypothetical protein